MSASNSSAQKPKRRKSKKKFPNEKDNHWSDEEVEVLLKSIVEFGHLDYKNILKRLPKKTLKSYQYFLRTTQTTARSKNIRPPECHFNLNTWIEMCESEYAKAGFPDSSGPLEIATVLRLLSMDGVLENHPLPEKCGGVDFGACYRLLSQAVLGHPLQPVNQPTLDIFYEIFNEVTRLAENNAAIVETIKTHLDSEFGLRPPCAPVEDFKTLYNVDMPQKKIKAYGRKKPANTVTSQPVLNLSVEPVPGSSKSNAFTVKSITENVPFNISLTVPERIDNTAITEEERKTLESTVYNPLKFPITWLKNTELEINYRILQRRRLSEYIQPEASILFNLTNKHSNKP